MISVNGKTRVGRSLSTCYIEIECKDDIVIIGTADTKFIVNAEDLQKELNRNAMEKQGISAPKNGMDRVCVG